MLLKGFQRRGRESEFMLVLAPIVFDQNEEQNLEHTNIRLSQRLVPDRQTLSVVLDLPDPAWSRIRQTF